MTISEMIRKYDLRLVEVNGKDAIQTHSKLTAAEINMLKAKKDETIAYMLKVKADEQRAREEREKKIEAIEGLNEIENSIREWEKHLYAFNKAVERGTCNIPSSPKVEKPEVLMAKYPRAAAYLKAQSWSNGANYTRMAIGSKALERIINEEDYNTVIAEMEKEWSAEVEESMWN